MVPWVNGPFPVRLWRGSSGNWSTPTRERAATPVTRALSAQRRASQPVLCSHPQPGAGVVLSHWQCDPEPSCDLQASGGLAPRPPILLCSFCLEPQAVLTRPSPLRHPFRTAPSPPHLKRTPYPVGRFSSRHFSCLTGILSLYLICVSGDEAREEGAVTVPPPLWPLASEPGRAGAWPLGALPATLPCRRLAGASVLAWWVCTHHAVRLPTAYQFPGAQNAVHCSLQMLS